MQKSLLGTVAVAGLLLLAGWSFWSLDTNIGEISRRLDRLTLEFTSTTGEPTQMDYFETEYRSGGDLKKVHTSITPGEDLDVAAARHRAQVEAMKSVFPKDP